MPDRTPKATQIPPEVANFGLFFFWRSKPTIPVVDKNFMNLGVMKKVVANDVNAEISKTIIFAASRCFFNLLGLWLLQLFETPYYLHFVFMSLGSSTKEYRG